eukprot:SAG31_NODE_6146_length_2149_cov_1.921951_2_plen_367_part_00
MLLITFASCRYLHEENFVHGRLSSSSIRICPSICNVSKDISNDDRMDPSKAIGGPQVVLAELFQDLGFQLTLDGTWEDSDAMNANGASEESTEFTAVITDFEYCCSLSGSSDVQRPGQSIHDRFAAPEVASVWPCTPHADTWSLGSILHFMLTGSLPITEIASESVVLDPSISFLELDLLQSCLKFSTPRILLADIVMHSWMTDDGTDFETELQLMHETRMAAKEERRKRARELLHTIGGSVAIDLDSRRDCLGNDRHELECDVLTSSSSTSTASRINSDESDNVASEVVNANESSTSSENLLDSDSDDSSDSDENDSGSGSGSNSDSGVSDDDSIPRPDVHAPPRVPPPPPPRPTSCRALSKEGC